MAAPTYSSDLVDIDLCERTKTWAEPTATGWTSGAAPSTDDDNPFQGTLAISKAFNAVGVIYEGHGEVFVKLFLDNVVLLVVSFPEFRVDFVNFLDFFFCQVVVAVDFDFFFIDFFLEF